MAPKHRLLKSHLTRVPIIHLKKSVRDKNMPILRTCHIKNNRLLAYEMHRMQQRLVLAMWLSLSKKWNAPMQSALMDEPKLPPKSMHIMVLLHYISPKSLNDDVFIGTTWSIQGDIRTLPRDSSISALSIS